MAKREQSRYQRKKERGIVPHRYSGHYRRWRRSLTRGAAMLHDAYVLRTFGAMPGWSEAYVNTLKQIREDDDA